MAKCLTPFSKMDENTGRFHDFPCGKCPDCLARRASGWSFRLVQEGRRSASAFFVTLTYDTFHVPITDKKFMSLKKTDLQCYFKRLRKLHDRRYGKEYNRIKYYACGEYGSENSRPHYHLILFNAHKEDIQKAWSLNGYSIGDVYFGYDCSQAAIGYCLKYMCKEDSKKLGYHEKYRSWDDRQPEFSLMSQGLGSNYITPETIMWHTHPSVVRDRMYIPLPTGGKIAMPRWYKDKIYTELERSIAADAMQKKVQIENDKYHRIYGDTMEQKRINLFRAKAERFKHVRLQEKL